MRWGLSVLDWRSHAINEVGEQPIGVLKAECGHLLMMVTTLHEKPSGVPREGMRRAAVRPRDGRGSRADPPTAQWRRRTGPAGVDYLRR
jgi:hypothetical protein